MSDIEITLSSPAAPTAPLKAERIQLMAILERVSVLPDEPDGATERNRRVEAGYRRRVSGDFWPRPVESGPE